MDSKSSEVAPLAPLFPWHDRFRWIFHLILYAFLIDNNHGATENLINRNILIATGGPPFLYLIEGIRTSLPPLSCLSRFRSHYSV